ncbi:MAG: ChaN family lipoprotein, partial [Bdellovibrionaceae bacterium]|nr:ChaN family lipoprotein [Pseudobdellovibrionaceae bacterium]
MEPVSKRASHTRHIRKAKRPPHAVADPQWLRVREQLLRQMKEQVRRRLGEEPESIRAYTKRWEREMRAPWKPSDKAELVAAVERADVVFGGDFHAFAQAQRTHLKILKALTISRKLVLALEAFAPRHQVWLDQYMAGEMEEVELLRRTRWKTHWGFPWENYRPLVEFIRQQGHGLLAVGSDRRGESLRDREVSAAKTLQGYLQETDHSSVLIYVLFGDLHLASQHLPKIASSCMRDLALRFVTIHLNPEKLYFELARRGLESEIDVLRLGADRFCVIASPPWVQWQSYLMYLENAHDTDLKDDGGEGVDWTDHVSAILHLLAQDLELDFSGDDILVFTAGDARLWLRLRAELSVRELKFARHLIQVGRSFFIPRSGIFFLARPTINHAAELVGHYIHCRLSERTRPLWRMPKDFQALCWAEAVAFFFSKLVNHKRHAETLTDLRTGLAVTSPRDRSRATT